MSKFPVEMSDDEGQTDAINYLLSGPSGLGQNFGGVSFSEVAYLSGSHTDPFMSSTSKLLQSDIIAINIGYFLDAITVKIEFAGAPLGTIPFDNGDVVLITGTSNANVEGFYTVGVIECTNSYVILRDPNAFTPTPGTFTGGYILKTVTFNTYNPTDSVLWQPTDCNSFASVTGETDRVFISGEFDFNIQYTVTVAGTYDLTMYTAINRYKAIPGESLVNPKINFTYDGIVTDASYGFNSITTSGETGFRPGPTFISVIDNPGPGYYWYVIEVYFLRGGGTTGFYVDYFYTSKRSLSTQVVKQ